MGTSILNDPSKFKNQILRYKLNTDFETLFVMLTELEFCYCLHMCDIDKSFNEK